MNNHIEENVTDDLNSPQINLGPGGEDTIYIVGNEIDGAFGTHRVGGISVADLMGTGSTKVLLKDNHVTKGRYGYNQQGLTISSVIEGNQFIDNYYEDNPMNGGSGISIYGVDENNKAVLRNNVITGNLWGITVINAADIKIIGIKPYWQTEIIDRNAYDYSDKGVDNSVQHEEIRIAVERVRQCNAEKYHAGEKRSVALIQHYGRVYHRDYHCTCRNID